MQAWYGRIWLSAAQIETRLAGEAAFVEVTPGRYLIALLDEKMKERFHRATDIEIEGSGKWLGRIPEVKSVITLAPDNYPPLVTLSNVADPKSVRIVDPRNLAATFGPGYALKAITMEITNEPVTKGRIDDVLPWVSDLVGSIGKDMNLPYDHLLRRIDDGSFRRGLN